MSYEFAPAAEARRLPSMNSPRQGAAGVLSWRGAAWKDTRSEMQPVRSAPVGPTCRMGSAGDMTRRGPRPNPARENTQRGARC